MAGNEDPPDLDFDALARRLAALLRPGDVDGMFSDDEVMGLFTSELSLSCFARSRYEDSARWARVTLARRSRWLSVHALHAASCAHLGRSAEAWTALRRLLEISPDFSLRHARLLFSGRDPEFLERLGDGLRKAGLSEASTRRRRIFGRA